MGSDSKTEKETLPSLPEIVMTSSEIALGHVGLAEIEVGNRADFHEFRTLHHQLDVDVLPVGLKFRAHRALRLVGLLKAEGAVLKIAPVGLARGLRKQGLPIRRGGVEE